MSYRDKAGRRKPPKKYMPPARVNPGNIIDCGALGRGNMGHPLCHQNEAPFPETLAEFFIRSFCPPGGLVVDPFMGSGTTICMARKHHRRAFGMDVRASQVKLTKRRLRETVIEPTGAGIEKASQDSCTCKPDHADPFTEDGPGIPDERCPIHGK